MGGLGCENKRVRVRVKRKDAGRVGAFKLDYVESLSGLRVRVILSESGPGPGPLSWTVLSL